MKAVYGLLNDFGSLLIQLFFEATFIKKLKMISNDYENRCLY